MKKLFIILFLCSFNLYGQGGRLIPNPLRKIPTWVRQEFSARQLDKKYSISFRLYPYYFHGDFNGDGRNDAVIQIIEKRSGKAGIVIFHGKKPQALFISNSVLGAGTPLGSAGDDFRWVDIWNIEERGDRGTISMEKRGSRSGQILWDGKNYTWRKTDS